MKLFLSEILSAEKLKVSVDTQNVENIYGMFCGEQGSLLFANFYNRSVKRLQLQSRTVKTLYKSDWYVQNMLLQSGDSRTLLVCERKAVYVLCLRSASLLSFF